MGRGVDVSRRKRRGCGFKRFVRQIDPVFTRLDHGALGVFVPRHFPPFLCDFRRLSFSPFEGLERSQRTLNRLPEPRAVARTLENAEAVGTERLREVVERVNDLRLTAPEAFSSNLFKAVRHFVLRRKVK